jgi:hypothetical protein
MVVVDVIDWPAYAVLEQVGVDPSKVINIEQPEVGEVKPIERGRTVGGTL